MKRKAGGGSLCSQIMGSSSEEECIDEIGINFPSKKIEKREKPWNWEIDGQFHQT